MSFVNRIKNMILAPKKEWAVIAAEEPNTDAIFTKYALPLVVASAAAGFIGYAFIWRHGLHDFWREGYNDTDALFNRGLSFGIQAVLVGALGVWLTAVVVNALAQKFGSEKNMGRSMQLVAYAMTPVLIGGLAMIYPPVGGIGLLFGSYGLYLLYLGLPQLMKTPEDKILPYSVLSIAVLLVIYIGIGFLFRVFLWDVMIDFLKNMQINAHPLK